MQSGRRRTVESGNPLAPEVETTMTNPFLSSEEYDERAHALYNDGSYAKAVELLSEGLALYPGAVELHVGLAYAWLAQEEFAWARRSFEEALILDPEHEDALAGLGDVLLRLGRPDAAMRLFDRVIALGYADDGELMLQIGRSLFREDMTEEALTFFNRALVATSASSEACAWVGILLHRIGRNAEAITMLRSAVQEDPANAEAQIYLANMLYEAGDREEALKHFHTTHAEDHWDEMGITRYIELEKEALGDSIPPGYFDEWEYQLVLITEDFAPEDILLSEVEQSMSLTEAVDNGVVQAVQLESLGSMLTELAQKQKSDGGGFAEQSPVPVQHYIEWRDGITIQGTWEEIVMALRDLSDDSRSLEDYMAYQSRLHYGATGVRLSTHAAEAFIRDSADAGLLRIIR